MQPLQLMTVKNLYGALSKYIHYNACDDVTWHLLPDFTPANFSRVSASKKQFSEAAGSLVFFQIKY